MTELVSMAGKVVLVTGATGGIGKATAIALATMGARVGITGRDLSRSEAAAADIRSASDNQSVDAFAADLSSQAEVRRFAGAVLNTYPRVDVLINNVGGFWAHRHETADGLEHTFALNHMAPFLLTNLLLERLKASAPARIVTLSSGAQSMGRIDFDDLQGARNYSGQRAYSQSKLASVMFTNELARRLEGTGVTATSVHPGVVRTKFGAEDQAWFFSFISGLIRPLLKTPAQGADTPVYMASSPEMDGVTGGFFANRRPKPANKTASDSVLTARLWAVSSALVLPNSSQKLGPRAGATDPVSSSPDTTYLNRPEGRLGYDIGGDGPLVVLVPGMDDLRATYGSSPDDDCRRAKVLDQRNNVASRLHIAVGAECGVAVAVASKVGESVGS